jgi:hypothetical protein
MKRPFLYRKSFLDGINSNLSLHKHKPVDTTKANFDDTRVDLFNAYRKIE